MIHTKGSFRNSSQEKHQCTMEGSSQLYKKSTFPPLLESYLPLNCQNQNRANWQKPERNKKEPIRNNSHILSEEEKDELLKQALLEKHHLETYKNLYKIRNILYERYKTLLNQKVLKQRIQIKAFDLKHQQLKRKEQKCTPRRKLPFCKLSHDTKYLESVSQSNSYWVTGLHNELTKLGIIKNQQDYENFWKFAWEDIPGPKIKEKLPDIKAKS
ncbi:uncharacterized protein LOC113439299 [Pseudonaja textilis]|uniref:uncharacterized protein LOC113439299 n=1 Tax=Pseudonaja textilis TaxID=8673 RepID=UPI000EAA39F8|nr:uncharacterized protein LOC113439299 [Pseudonaja textilis]